MPPKVCDIRGVGDYSIVSIYEYAVVQASTTEKATFAQPISTLQHVAPPLKR